jgi:hypothetical protein
MKVSALLFALVALAFGFAAGSYFSPTWSHFAAAESPGLNLVPSKSSTPSGSTFPNAEREAVSQPARRVPTLESLMGDTSSDYFSYQRTKDVMAYAESLSPAEIGDAVRKVEKMPNNMAKFRLRYMLIMRWADGDPQGALAWSQQKGGGQFDHFMKRETVQMAMGNIAKNDVAGAHRRGQSSCRDRPDAGRANGPGHQESGRDDRNLFQMG